MSLRYWWKTTAVQLYTIFIYIYILFSIIFLFIHFLHRSVPSLWAGTFLYIHLLWERFQLSTEWKVEKYFNVKLMWGKNASGSPLFEDTSAVRMNFIYTVEATREGGERPLPGGPADFRRHLSLEGTISCHRPTWWTGFGCERKSRLNRSSVHIL